MAVLLDAAKAIEPANSEFKVKTDQLKGIAMDRIRQEGSTMFTAIRHNCNSEKSE